MDSYEITSAYLEINDVSTYNLISIIEYTIYEVFSSGIVQEDAIYPALHHEVLLLGVL